jgi:hypothetical protein
LVLEKTSRFFSDHLLTVKTDTKATNGATATSSQTSATPMRLAVVSIVPGSSPDHTANIRVSVAGSVGDGRIQAPDLAASP